MSKLLEQINTKKYLGAIKDLVFPVSNTYNFSNKDKVIFINTGDILEGKFLHNNYSDTKKLPGQAKKIIEKGDILFSEIRPKNRHFAVVDFDSSDYVVSTKLIVLKVKENIDPVFAYTVLTADQNLKEFQDIAESRSGTFPQITFDSIAGYEVNIPDLPTQKKIAEILSAYDVKIENNNKIIKNLDTTAQTIFTEWFVKFRFPGYEKAKFVENEMGEIPEGWEFGKVKDLINVESGFPFSSSIFHKEGKYKLVTIRNVQDGEFVLDCDNKILELPEKLPEHCKLKTGNILLSLTGNVGRICLVIGSDYVLNQRVSNLVPVKETNRAFTYFLFRQKEFQNLLISMGKGSAQSNLSPIDTKNIGIVIPNNQTLEKFNQQMFSFFEQIISLKEENISLVSSRDQLLAKLI